MGLLATKALNASGHPARVGWPTNIVALGVLACAPDLDFAWGRHSMETHSLGAALLAGLVALGATRDARFSAACVLAWGSHVLFDWLGSDITPPLGVMALWPFSSEFFFADAFLFEAISRRYWLENFLWHNARAVASELLILGPLAFLALLRARRAGRAVKVEHHPT